MEYKIFNNEISSIHLIISVAIIVAPEFFHAFCKQNSKLILKLEGLTTF